MGKDVFVVSTKLCSLRAHVPYMAQCLTWLAPYLPLCMEYDCHIFLKYLVFRMKSSFSIEISSTPIENLGFPLKYQVFPIRNLEILGFSGLKFEILGEILTISSEIPSTSKLRISTKQPGPKRFLYLLVVFVCFLALHSNFNYQYLIQVLIMMLL